MKEISEEKNGKWRGRARLRKKASEKIQKRNREEEVIEEDNREVIEKNRGIGDIISDFRKKLKKIPVISGVLAMIGTNMIVNYFSSPVMPPKKPILEPKRSAHVAPELPEQQNFRAMVTDFIDKTQNDALALDLDKIEIQDKRTLDTLRGDNTDDPSNPDRDGEGTPENQEEEIERVLTKVLRNIEGVSDGTEQEAKDLAGRLMASIGIDFTDPVAVKKLIAQTTKAIEKGSTDGIYGFFDGDEESIGKEFLKLQNERQENIHEAGGDLDFDSKITLTPELKTALEIAGDIINIDVENLTSGQARKLERKMQTEYGDVNKALEIGLEVFNNEINQIARNKKIEKGLEKIKDTIIGATTEVTGAAAEATAKVAWSIFVSTLLGLGIPGGIVAIIAMAIWKRKLLLKKGKEVGEARRRRRRSENDDDGPFSGNGGYDNI